MRELGLAKKREKKCHKVFLKSSTHGTLLDVLFVTRSFSMMRTSLDFLNFALLLFAGCHSSRRVITASAVPPPHFGATFHSNVLLGRKSSGCYRSNVTALMNGKR